MNCKRCLHTGEKLPGRVANISNDPIHGSVFDFCADHVAWANRLMMAACRQSAGKSARFDLYNRLTALYARGTGSVKVRHTGKSAAAARVLFN